MISGLLVIFVVFALMRVFVGHPQPDPPRPNLARGDVAFLGAAAEAMFPAGGAIPVSGVEADLPGYVDDYLGRLPSHLRLQIRALLFLFQHATLFFPASGWDGLRRFSGLSVEQRGEVMRGWEESRLFPRRLVFTALRAVLTMGYLGDSRAMRHLHVAPYAIASPVCKADVLYPPIGKRKADNPYTIDDLTPPSDGTPIDLDGPLHPAYAEPGGPAQGAAPRSQEAAS